MTDILTVTLSPAVDIAANIQRLEAGGKLRCHDPQIDPGGGGVNVSRAIKALAGESVAFAALGGPIGDFHYELLTSEGIEVSRFDLREHTRQSFAITEEGTGQQYRFVLPGPNWSEDECVRAKAKLIELSKGKSYVVLSGGNPPGAPDDLYVRIASSMPESTRIVMDTSGAALAAATENTSKLFYCIRMNWREAQQFSGDASDKFDANSIARSLVDRGVAENVIITRGETGAAIETADASFHVTPPPVKVVSAVGAGDSFVGAFVLALSRNWALRDACRYAVAAAAAAMMTPATKLCRKSDVRRILSEIP